MKIIVVGCGKVGLTLVESLVKEHHDVIVVDNDAAVVEDVRNAYDVIALVGNGTDVDNLREVGVDKAELFIAVTGSDEINMLACFAAKRLGANHTVARIRDLGNNDDSLRFMKQNLDISLVVNPERMTAEAIYNILQLPSATNVELFPRSRFEMIEVQLPATTPLAEKTIIDARRLIKEKFLVCAVERNDRIFIPGGQFTFAAKDKVGIITNRKDAPKILHAFGIENISVKNVMIVGAGVISVYLAKLLLDGKHSVKLIDSDREVCEEVCEALPETATVICGNGMSQELLQEEGLENTHAVVSLTGRDEDNILLSFYAMSRSVPKVIAKVNNKDLSALAENLGLACMVTPKKIVADLILKYARGLQSSMDSQIEALYSVMDGHAEAMDFKVLEDFEYANTPIKELKFLPNVLIAGITRGRETIIPTGDDVIMTGDYVIVITAGKRILSLSDIFEG